MIFNILYRYLEVIQINHVGLRLGVNWHFLPYFIQTQGTMELMIEYTHFSEKQPLS